MAVYGAGAGGYWNGTGSQSLVLAANANGFYYSIGGAAYSGWGPTFTHTTRYSSIFDAYRITGLTIEVFYSANSQPESSTYALPNMYAAVDQTDGSVIASISDILAYQSMEYMQMGNMPMVPGKPLMRLSNRKPLYNINTDVTTVASSSTTLLSQPSPWLATSASTQETGYFKLWFDPLYTNASSIGQITILCYADFEFKNVA